MTQDKYTLMMSVLQEVKYWDDENLLNDTSTPYFYKAEVEMSNVWTVGSCVLKAP